MGRLRSRIGLGWDWGESKFLVGSGDDEELWCKWFDEDGVEVGYVGGWRRGSGKVIGFNEESKACGGCDWEEGVVGELFWNEKMFSMNYTCMNMMYELLDGLKTL